MENFFGSDIISVLLGPTGVLILAVLFSYLPERCVEVDLHLYLDLRAAALLSALAAGLASWSAAPKSGTLEEPLPAPKEEEEALPEEGELCAEDEKEEGEEDNIAKEPEEPPKPPPPPIHPEVNMMPEELLRALVTWKFDGGDSDALKLECPVCHDIMLRPMKTSCSHHACETCLKTMHRNGLKMCPICNVSINLEKVQPGNKDMSESLATLPCACAGCKEFEGNFSEFSRHIKACAAVQGTIALRSYCLATETEARRKQDLEAAATELLFKDMAAASACLVHRFPADAFERDDGKWSSPIFAACDRFWTIRMGALTNAGNGSKYFCILPHGGHTDRLKCNLIFAKKASEGYAERKVHDWPSNLKGHPWGPTITADELEQYKQADGSVLLMVHAAGLAWDDDHVSP